MSIDKAHCKQEWRVSTPWLHSLFWVYFQTTVSEQPSSVTYFNLSSGREGRQTNAVNIGIQLTRHVPSFPKQHIFLFSLLSAHRAQYTLQVSHSPTSSLLLPLFRITRWWSFLYCFALFLSCFVFVVFSFSSLDQENKAAQEFGAYNFWVAMYPILQHRLVEWPNASSSISSCLCGCSSSSASSTSTPPFPPHPPLTLL
jgi:hypothetical protein